MRGGTCRPRDECGFLSSVLLWDTPVTVHFSSSSSWLCPTCCQEGRGSDLPGALVPKGNCDGCSCHVLSATSVCVALPVLDLSVTAGLGSCDQCQIPLPAKLSPRQGQPRGPCEDGAQLERDGCCGTLHMHEPTCKALLESGRGASTSAWDTPKAPVCPGTHSPSPGSPWHGQCRRNAGSCSTAITHTHTLQPR